MKKYLYIIGLASILCACSTDESSPNSGNPETANRDQFQIIDLSEGGLPLALRVPLGENPGITSKWNPTFGRMELSDASGISIFIAEDTLSCAMKKSEIEDGIFKIAYLIGTEHLLYYKSTLPDGSSPYWHFFASYEIGDKNYIFENNPLIEFTEKEVKSMTEITKNICQQENLNTGIYGKAN